VSGLSVLQFFKLSLLLSCSRVPHASCSSAQRREGGLGDRAVRMGAPSAAGPAGAGAGAGGADPPEPRLEELLGNTRRHVQWHGMERAVSATERTLERLGAARTSAKRERLATRNSLYAMTTPRRVNRPPLTAPARSSGSGYKERSRAREEELKKQGASIHDRVVFTPELEAALTKRLCQPKPGPPPAQHEPGGEGSVAWAAGKDCRVTANSPWPQWHTMEARPGGRKLLDPKGSGKPMHGTVAIVSDHAADAADDVPSIKPPLDDIPRQPQPPKPIHRTGTPTDRKWHNFGTPTRALERRVGQVADQTPVAKQAHGAPVAWGGGHHSVVRGRSTRPIDLIPGRSRVHGQYVLRKEQSSGFIASSIGASPLSASCAARGFVPAVVATTAEPQKMKAWIVAMSDEAK
jgi:hypothetical protein